MKIFMFEFLPLRPLVMDLHMIAIFLAAAFAVRSSALYPGKCFIYEV